MFSVNTNGNVEGSLNNRFPYKQDGCQCRLIKSGAPPVLTYCGSAVIKQTVPQNNKLNQLWTSIRTSTKSPPTEPSLYSETDGDIMRPLQKSLFESFDILFLQFYGWYLALATWKRPGAHRGQQLHWPYYVWQLNEKRVVGGIRPNEEQGDILTLSFKFMGILLTFSDFLALSSRSFWPWLWNPAVALALRAWL